MLTVRLIRERSPPLRPFARRVTQRDADDGLERRVLGDRCRCSGAAASRLCSVGAAACWRGGAGALPASMVQLTIGAAGACAFPLGVVGKRGRPHVVDLELNTAHAAVGHRKLHRRAHRVDGGARWSCCWRYRREALHEG